MDLNDVFSPVVKHISIRVIIAMVVSLDIKLEEMDVKTDFYMVTFTKPS